MAIKGSATIELTNADGTKQIIKHDNMITNAVADMFRSYMGDMPLIHKLNFYDYTYAGTIFGGLLLFDDRLNDDASDYAIPSTKITGYASDTAYSGQDLSRGSRNIAESGLQEDGSYKLVWDFGTSQGNGTIQSIALCPIAMGKIGASDAPVRSEYVSYRLGEEAYVSSRDSDAKGAFFDYYRLIDQKATVDGINADCLCPIAIVGEYIYAIDTRSIDYYYSNRAYTLVDNGGILKLYKFKYQFNSVSISATTGRAKYVETIEVQIPTEIVNLAYTTTSSYVYGIVGIHFNKRDSKLIVFPYSLKTALAPNATLPYVDIDLLDNCKVTNYTMTNTTNQSFSIRGNSINSLYGARYGLYISNDHILMIGGTGADARMYVINRTDNAKVVKVKIGGEDFVPYNLNYENALNFCPKIINNNTAVVVFGAYSRYEPYDMYIIDLTTGVAKKCNTATNVNHGKVINMYRPFMTDGAIVYDSDVYVGCTPKLNPFILTTKNNLDEPVVKTASQTMKITYTLTESAGV